MYIEEKYIQSAELKSDLEIKLYNFFKENYKEVYRIYRESDGSNRTKIEKLSISLDKALQDYVEDVFRKVAMRTPIAIRGSSYKYVESSLREGVVSKKVCEEWWESDYGYVPHYAIDFAANESTGTKLFLLYTSLISSFNYGIDHLLSDIIESGNSTCDLEVGVLVFPQFTREDRREREMLMLLDNIEGKDPLHSIPISNVDPNPDAYLELITNNGPVKLPVARESKYIPYYLFPIEEHSPMLLLKITLPAKSELDLLMLWNGENSEYYMKLGAIMTAGTLKFLKRNYNLL